MKRTIKILVSMLLSLSLCVTLFYWHYVPSEAAHAAKYAVRDPDGNIIVTTYDHHSSVYTYKTIGCTVSRCTPGTMQRSPGKEFIVFAFNESVIESSTLPDQKGMIITNFKIPESAFIERIATFYGDNWLSDIQSDSEMPVYVVIDSIMCCCYYDAKTNERIMYGNLRNDGTRTGRFIGNTYWNIPDTMSCDECGGNFPPLKDGWLNWDSGISSTPICAMNHPNCKDGSSTQFDGI